MRLGEVHTTDLHALLRPLLYLDMSLPKSTKVVQM